MMAKVSLQTIKNWFKTGLKPTQAQFWDTWDSFRHKDENIPNAEIEGLATLLNEKASAEALSNHLSDANAHGGLGGEIAVNATAIATLQDEQTTQNDAIALNTSNIANLETNKQNTLIAGDNITIVGTTINASGGGGATVLEKAVNGGIFVSGRNEANYGNIGDSALDLSVSVGASATYGATGMRSSAFNQSSTALGFSSHADSSGTASGNYSHADSSGTASGLHSHADAKGTANGWYASASGWTATSSSYSERAIGTHNTIYTALSESTFNLLDRVFVVGIGEFLAKKDAFTILKNGKVGVGINNFETTANPELLQVSGKVRATSLVLGDWEILPFGTSLEFRNLGIAKARITSAGVIEAVDHKNGIT